MLASERAVYVLSLVVLILVLPAVCGSGGSGILSGTSAVLGPGTLGAGGCDTATITVTGVTSAMAIVATPAAGDIAGGLGTIHWFGYRSAANTLTLNICNADTSASAGYPPESTDYSALAPLGSPFTFRRKAGAH